MRLAVSGTASQGKTTLIKDFLAVWPMYKTPSKSYRDVLVENNLQHSSKTTQHTQQCILDFMVKQLSETSKDDNIIMDRCPLDNLVYSMWMNSKDNKVVTDDFIADSIKKMQQSMKHIDIIFWIPYSESIAIAPDSLRDTDLEYIKEVDALFKEIYTQNLYNVDFSLFLKGDRPPIISISGTRENRIMQIADYVDLQGTVVEPDEQFMSQLTTPEGANQLEQLIKQQKSALLDETGNIFVG
jgi:predicted ATPase